MRKTKEKLFRQFVTIALFMLTLLQACGEATITPVIPTATQPVTPTAPVPTPSPKPVVTTTTVALVSSMAIPFRADTSQIEGKDYQANDTLKVNWVADKQVFFTGMSSSQPNILTLKVFGPFPSNQEAQNAVIGGQTPIIVTQVDPKTYQSKTFTTELKLPDNLSPGYYSLLCFSEMGSYGDTSITVFKVVK